MFFFTMWEILTRHSTTQRVMDLSVLAFVTIEFHEHGLRWNRKIDYCARECATEDCDEKNHAIHVRRFCGAVGSCGEFLYQAVIKLSNFQSETFLSNIFVIWFRLICIFN